MRVTRLHYPPSTGGLGFDTQISRLVETVGIEPTSTVRYVGASLAACCLISSRAQAGPFSVYHGGLGSVAGRLKVTARPTTIDLVRSFTR